jgi:hypothetical protein
MLLLINGRKEITLHGRAALLLCEMRAIRSLETVETRGISGAKGYKSTNLQ